MKREAGNALFLILIAVALFAALSYAVTNSGRGSGNIDRENFSLAFAEVQDIIGQYQYAMKRVLILNRVQIERLDARFDDANFVNTNCTLGGQSTPGECQMFHEDGGGLPRPGLERKNEASFGPETASYYNWEADRDGVSVNHFHNWSGTPSNAADPIITMFTNRDFCQYFNERNGVTTPIEDSTLSTALAFHWLSTNWASNNAIPANSFTGGQVPGLAGKTQGCFRRSFSGVYAYVIVELLWPR